MSEFSGVAPAKRGQVLLIVEGAKQEPQFLMLLSRCFPNLSISKANMIQYGKYDVSSGMLKKIYSTIDYGAILREQNRCSAGIDGFLWVLNTGVFFVIDYNFDLIEDKGS